jgi:hypothetical protein
MSEPTCDLVAERLALGDSLAELDAHAATCERCKRLLALPASLAKTAHAADPGIGFSSRVTAGAQHRITVRRHRRIALASAMSVAAAALMVLVATRHAEEPGVAFAMPSLDKYKPAVMPPHDPWRPREVDPDVRALVDLADVDQDLHFTANWGRIEKPLRPYKAVLEGKAP